MTASSNTASENFAAVWSLVLLGALRRSEERTLPFDDEWRQHSETHREDLARIRSALASIDGFMPAVADMLLADTPWRAQQSSGYLTTHEAIAAELAMMVGAGPGDLERVLDTPVTERENRAVRRQLAQLLNGLLAATFEAKQDQFPAAQMRSILLAGAGLAGEQDPSASIADAASEWETVFLPRLRATVGFEAWATNAVSRVVEPDLRGR